MQNTTLQKRDSRVVFWREDMQCECGVVFWREDIDTVWCGVLEGGHLFCSVVFWREDIDIGDVVAIRIGGRGQSLQSKRQFDRTPRPQHMTSNLAPSTTHTDDNA